jgi:hypothetical protein
MKAIARALLVVALLPTLAFAGELAGVTMPDTAEVSGKTLALNGMGLRKKFVFKVYVAGLYLEEKSKDAKTVIEKDQVRKVHMKMLRNLDKKTMAEAIESGFTANNKDKMPALRERLDKLLKDIVDLKEKDDVTITYTPGKGTALAVQGKDGTTVEGKDFADAMFSVWLGANPVDDSLKSGMLGKE